jgi:peptidyl-prolyl cis-trans isomerase A (cyclophilin A)
MCSQPQQGNPIVKIETAAGDIEVELFQNKAPKSVTAFLSHVDNGIYNNASFYRILNEDNQPSTAIEPSLIQGGTYKSKNAPQNLAHIPHETTQETGILHKAGTISLARLEPGTATTEFFICLNDEPGFDYGGENNPDKHGYAAFGKVVKGMDVVRKIYNRPEEDQAFTPPVAIYNIKRR